MHPPLVRICADCWQRRTAWFQEVLWRWAFGVPACGLVYFAVGRLAAQMPARSVLLAGEPLQAAQQLLQTAEGMAGPAEHMALWLFPLLAIGWVVASGFGRNAVLRRIEPGLRSGRLATAWTLAGLQLIRLLALFAACVAWYRALSWAAATTLAIPQPNLVAYSAWVICLSLGAFVVWAMVSWIFSIAPVVALLEGTGVVGSLRLSFRLGGLARKLAEVNLALGIVRLALIVLALVFSAIPLPFEADMQGIALYLWWVVVTVLYLVASDFFQVVRLTAYIRYWQYSVAETLAPGSKA